MDQIVQKIFQGIVEGQQDDAAEGVATASGSGVPPKTILDEDMLAAMAEIVSKITPFPSLT